MFSGCLLFVTSPVSVHGEVLEFPLSSYEVSGLVLSFGGQGSSDKCGCMRSGGYRVASQRQQREFPLSSYEVSGLVLSFGGQGSSEKCGCMRSRGYRVASQRQQRVGAISFCRQLLYEYWPFGVILSSSVAPRLSGDNLSLRGSSDETESSLSVARRRKDDSLSLRGSLRKRSQTSLSLADGEEEIVDYLPLRGSPRRRRTALSLWVDILDSEGKSKSFVRFFLAVALVDGDIWLSVGGSPPRRRSSLSMPLRDSYRDQREMKGSTCVSYVLWNERSGRFINTGECYSPTSGPK
ncbi:hypothetical protein YC2023_042250 [Brassica napus]